VADGDNENLEAMVLQIAGDAVVTDAIGPEGA
jgi:hypothetical protein